MHQIRFPLRLRPKPRWGSLELPNPQLYVRDGGRVWPTQKFWRGAPYGL